MDTKTNGWTVLLVLGAIALGYCFSLLNSKFMIPATVAQIGGNQALVKELKTVLDTNNKATATWQTQISTRLTTLEQRK